MIEETGRVVAVEGEQAWVQTVRHSTCQSCSARNGCGQRLMTELSGNRAHGQVWLPNRLDARVGDEVVLGIGETDLLKASLRAYILPLAGLILGAGIGKWLLGPEDTGVVLSAFAGMALAFLVLRLSQQREGNRRFEPVMVRIQPSPGPAIT